mmetsp:Transcript_28228/g.47922  ORF Transcript_28228/g.47922 Transcript_28228/m.47922 type:complete len:109 (+) Transcript_28228:660-986(+)
MDREKTKVHMMTVEQLMDSHDCFKPYGIEDFKGYIKDVDKRTRDLRSVIDDEEKAFRSFQIKYPRNELTNGVDIAILKVHLNFQIFQACKQLSVFPHCARNILFVTAP